MTRFPLPRRVAMAVLAGLLVGHGAGPSLAQTGGDFGGSFDPGAPPAQVTAPPAAPPASGGDSFGGSFDSEPGGGAAPAPGGGAAPTPPPPPPPPPPAGGTGGGTQPPAVGGGDFGGNFDPGPGDGGAGGGGQQPPATGGGTSPAPQPGPQVDPQIQAFELKDFGVPPTSSLRNGQFHAPTPTAIPGGQIVTTAQLAQAMTAGQSILLIDVLGGDYSLPGAFMAPALASPGSFNDRIQQQAVQWLGQISANNPGQVIVVYCSDPQCWLSYNAGLRVAAAGYTNLYWYRGGLQAWQMAGLPLYPSGF